LAEATHRTVLVVDDDEIKRYTVTRILEKVGFTIIEAATGAEALEHARTNPDIVILDVNLPDFDGFEVCRRLKSDPATASIIVLHLSATLVETADRVQGLESGADGYLTEPIGAAELVATVRSMLRIRAAERKASELSRQWQATFDAITDGVCLVDEDDRITRCNAAIERFTGRCASDLVGLDCSELSHGELGHEPLCRKAREHGTRQSAEYSHDGKWFRVAADPVFDDRGRASGSVYIVSDVTAAKEREREKADLLAREKAARAQAETANRAKDEFLATISHELRTPLNSMLGWLTLMRTGKLDAAGVARAIDTLERNTKSQTQLIADILDVSRIITGKVRVDVGIVNFVTVLEAALDSVRPSAEAKGVVLEAVLDPDAGSVSGDPERLKQVAWNLLANAIKFTAKDGRVDVSLRRAGSHVDLVVKDTGIGISPDFLPFVFDRFKQADSSTTRIHAGLGLGLAIVRHLVELHGGTVRAESEGSGHGATFTISLPIATGAPSRRGVDESGESRAKAEAPLALERLDGARILVIDDDLDSRQMLGTLFEQCGATVLTCSSAREGLDAVVAWQPDAIVSDIGMPEEDGNTLMRKVRALDAGQGGSTPAVALTAYAQAESRRRALDAGFQRFITKPVDPAEVTSVVADLVRKVRSGE
jgi:PAS domain S-box-containing protein